MAKKTWRGALASAPVIALTAALLVPTWGGASDDQPADEPATGRAALVTDGTIGVSQRDRAVAYWTEERMRNATPLPAPRVTNPAPEDTASTALPSGPGKSIRGGDSLAGEPPLAETSFGSQVLTYTYPFPFTRHAVDATYRRFPYKAVGKIFFTQGGVDRVCSGASVVSSPQNAVYTAGNCVSDGAGNFSTNVVFVPARQAGKNPYKKFPGSQLWTTSGWHFSGELTRNFAAFSVGTNPDGATLQSKVGTLGFQYDQSRVQHWDLLAYPADAPFNGERMVHCKASHATDDTGIPGSGPDPIGIGCDMTDGAHGGPWITMLNRGSYINSVVAYRYPVSQPGAVYGPYFDILANQVRCAAATGGSTSC